MDSITSQSVITDAAPSVVEELSGFFVGDDAPTVGVPSHGEMPAVHDTSSVGEFLSRPVLIGSYAWGVGNSLYLTVDPWNAFLTNAIIKPRISYFGRLRGDLVVKYVLNGTPMHYGLVRMCYRPHPQTTSTGDYVWNFTVATGAVSAANNFKIASSQLSGMYINPCRAATGQLRIPYISQSSGLELGYVGVDASRMGTLMLVGFTNLAHANGGSNPVTFDLYAHMENVTLDVPTAVYQGYTLQDAGKMAKRAFSAVAKATTIAHEWAPRIVSALAMLGFSRPNTHEPTIGVRALPYNLANYDAPDTATPLSLCATAEQTIGGQELGCDGKDELMFSSLASRYAFIATASWDPSMARTKFLFGSIVTPMQVSVSNYVKPATTTTPGGFSTVLHTCMTPCAFAAASCKYWRGVLSYRFTVVSSPYHKGRLRIYYEPFPAQFVVEPTPSMTLANSVVLDLAETEQVTVDVPWQNVRDMCEVLSPFTSNAYINQTNFTTRCGAVTTTNSNGIIVVEVLSPLTGLTTTNAAVVLMVEVCTKELVLFSPELHRTFGAPMSMDASALPYLPQSYDLTGGDAVISVRQLFKRYSLEHTVSLQSPIDALVGLNIYSIALSYISPVSLPVPGYPSVALAAVDVAANGEPISYTGLSFHTYFSLAFALARGAVRWKPVVCMRGGTTLASNLVGIARYTDVLPAIASRRPNTVSYANLAPSNTVTYARARNLIPAGWRRADTGIQLAESNTGVSPATLDVEFPFTSTMRAINPRASIGLSAEGRDDNNVILTLELPISTNSASTGYASYASVDVYTSVGEDFNLFSFTHAPAFLQSIPLAL